MCWCNGESVDHLLILFFGRGGGALISCGLLFLDHSGLPGFYHRESLIF